MKIRWTKRAVRLRIDDLELAALSRGETLAESLQWTGGAWSVTLQVGPTARCEARGGELHVTIDATELAVLRDDEREGIEREGPPRLLVEKDFLPLHGSGA